jgi:hypothetical protein
MRVVLDRSARRMEPIVSGGLVLAGLTLLLLARFFPFGTLPPLCTFKRFTGLPCLTCGMTRSWVAVSHGDLAQALAWNPGGAMLCLLTVLGTAYLVFRAAGAPALRLETSLAQGRAIRIGLVLGIAVNWAWVLVDGRV